jgi:hypothetical protein
VPARTAGVTLYEEARVRALIQRPTMTAVEWRTACPWGLFVARRPVSVIDTREQQVEAVSGGWQISPWTRLWIHFWCQRHRPMRGAGSPGSTGGACPGGSRNNWQLLDAQL